MQSNTTAERYAVYLRVRESGNGFISSGSPTIDTHTDEQENCPVALMLLRGNSVSCCIGSNYRRTSPDIKFLQDLTKARSFKNEQAAFEWVHSKITAQNWVQKMFLTRKFQCWDFEKLTMKESKSNDSANASLLGDGTGGTVRSSVLNSKTKRAITT